MKNFTKNIRVNNNKTRRIYIILFHVIMSATLFMALVPPTFAFFLPAELGNWRLLSDHVTDLTASEELGKWTSASYVRFEPTARIEVQLTEGSGPGELFVPEDIISSDDDPIGFLSTFETLSVAGKRAILERDSVTGQALAVAMGTRTVTFEASGISREVLLGFAENMIEALQDER